METARAGRSTVEQAVQQRLNGSMTSSGDGPATCATDAVTTQGHEEPGDMMGGDMLGGDGAGRSTVEQAVQQRLNGSVTSSGDGPATCATAAVTTQGHKEPGDNHDGWRHVRWRRWLVMP